MTLACAIGVMAGSLQSQPAPTTPARKPYSLPAGDAAGALQQFSRQSGEQIIFASEAVRGLRTRAVYGRYSAREALDLLLAGSGLTITRDERTGAFAVIRPARPPNSADQPAPARREENVYQLSPFEVRVDTTASYGALESNSLTAFRIDLDKLPVTAEIFTKTFMDDLAATSIEDMVVNYSGTAGFVGSAINRAPGDRDGAGGLSLRGLAIPGLKRDGFIGLRVNFRSATGSTDNFSTERVELLEGPQSLLYGGSGGGGIVNLVSKPARFGITAGEVRYTVDDHGSKRAFLDASIGRERFAFRIAATAHETRNLRSDLGGRFLGLYTQAAWRLSSGATLRLWAEHNSNDANHAFKPNLDPFLPAADPRRGLDARYLVLTGQLRDVPVVDGGLQYENIESLAGWWSGELIVNRFGGATLDTKLNRWLSAQFAVVYGDTMDSRIDPGRILVAPLTAANPLSVAAMQVTPGDNAQPHRIKGVRSTLLAEGDFFSGRAHSQTAFGFEAVHSTDMDSIDYSYYLADSDWRVVVDPAKAGDYGRSRLGPQLFAVGQGVPAEPLFRPRTARITINGRNYVRLSRIVADPRTATAGNPLGLVPNNPGVGNGFAGNYSHADTHSRGAFLSNFTDWFDGRLTTLVGARFTESNTMNAGPTGFSYRPPWDQALTGNVGFSYRLDPSLRAYATISTSYNPLSAQTRNLVGEQLESISARSPTPEIGLKFHTTDGRLLATLAYGLATSQRNEATTVDPSFLDAVNPAGINGRFRTPDRWVNFDRRSSNVELKLTAAPDRNWRLRLSVGLTRGETTSTVQFRQLYNDDFHTDGHGGVTYSDGTPVLVDPTGAGGPAGAPLSIAMLNDPASAFYAAPDVDSGRITGTNAIAALTRIDPDHGTAATGVTGLPISSIQYAWADPNRHTGTITVFRAGEKSTGYNEVNFNFQTNYVLDHGPLNGAGVFFDVRTYFKNRAYYVQTVPPGGRAVNGDRTLYRLPTATVCGLGLSYRHKLRERYLWSTQLTVNNVLNRYRVWTVPNPSGGAFNQARLSASPRQFVWTNAFSF